MTLITKLLSHKNDNNKVIVDKLIEIIKEENISSEEELSVLENNIFTINGKLMNMDEKVNYCKALINQGYYDYDGLSLEEINKLKKLKDSLKNNISNVEKILIIVKINLMTEREIMFVKEMYDYIVKGLI